MVYFLTAPAVCARPEQNSYQLQPTPSSAGASEGLALVCHGGEAWHVGEGEDGKVSSQQVSDFQFEADVVISCVTHSKPSCTGVVESTISTLEFTQDSTIPILYHMSVCTVQSGLEIAK